MEKARDLINAHLYPVLATFVVIYGAIQLAPMANQARHFNQCVERLKTSLASPSMGLVQSRFVTGPLLSYHCWSRKARATEGSSLQGAERSPLGE